MSVIDTSSKIHKLKTYKKVISDPVLSKRLKVAIEEEI